MSIIFKDVTYTYNKGTPVEKTAIKGLSLSIGSGEFVAVTGRPGSGRSTFVQLLGGLIKPTSGSITVSPRNSSELMACRGVGVVLQFPERQFFEESVYDDLSFPLRRAGISEEEIETRLRDALNAVDIDFHTYCDRSPLELSSGEKRRVAIAAILVLDPEVIALDEPLAGLDGRGKREIVKELKRLQGEMGKTVIVATQDCEGLLRICDRVIFLENGTLTGDGGAETIKGIASRTSPIQSLRDALKAKGVDLGNGVFDAEEAFLRIKGVK
ncbi:MAG: ATP-binding cassette domain-containing protein [Deltaproteobacteria bacterium]|nr:ATP-binding cassette domain-containing protein [Deltaproteobacteria bacterium]